MRLENVFDTDDEAGFLYRWFLKKRDKFIKDNIVFYFHYNVTSAFFMTACLIVTVGMFIMDPIECITDQAVDNVIDNYCLYHSTYTIAIGGVIPTKQDLQIHPGIPISNTKQPSGDLKYHHYYLWVAMMLVIQGSSFYVPRGLWRYLEGSRVEMVITVKDQAFADEEEEENTNGKSEIGTSTSTENQSEKGTARKSKDNIDEISSKDPPKLSKKKLAERVKQLAGQRLVNYLLSNSHNSYYWKLLICELLNLGNAIAQLLIIDMFVGFGLSSADLNIFQLIRDKRPFERSEAVEQMFPKISACTFYSYGPSGNIVNYQAICVLPINAINEKIFGLLFMWMLLLIGISALAVLYRIMMLLPFIRNFRINQHLRLEDVANFKAGERFSNLNKYLKIGNWQLLLQLAGNNNVDSWELTKIVENLCRETNKRT